MARTRLTERQAFVLRASNRRLQTPTVVVPSTCKEIVISLRRPTTALPVNWDATSTLRIILVLTVNGEERRCTGQATGGIRLDRSGVEVPMYQLTYHPSHQRIDGVDHAVSEGKSTSAHLILEWVRGVIDTEIGLLEVDA